MTYMETRNGNEELEMTIKHTFIEFGNLVGTVNFDNDTCYDDCHGWIKLIQGPETDDFLVYQSFYSPRQRDVLMQEAFELAAKYMGRMAKISEGF